MRQLRWYVGTVQQDGESVTQQQRKDVIDLLILAYGGATMYSTQGFWSPGPFDPLTIENTFVFEVITDDADYPSPNMREIADSIRDLANQKSVLFTDININSGGFADGDEPIGGAEQGDDEGEAPS